MAPVDRGEAEARFDTAVGPAGEPVVRLFGELDIATVPLVEKELDGVVKEADSRIVFDLSQLEFIDSSGIAMLLRTAARVNHVALRNPSNIVQRVIESTGLSGTLHVET